MTKAELIEHVSEKVDGLSKKQTEVVINTIFDSIKRALSEGDKIEIRGFGSFKIRNRRQREGRNPKSGGAGSRSRQARPVFQGRQGDEGTGGQPARAGLPTHADPGADLEVHFKACGGRGRILCPFLFERNRGWEESRTTACGRSPIVKILTSRANPLAKMLRSFAREGDPGGRTVFVEGVRLLDEALVSPQVRLNTVVVTEEAAGRRREQDLVDRSRESGARSSTCPGSCSPDFALPSPPGIAGVVDLGEEDGEARLEEGDGPILVLDGVQDPANVGMILRAAEAADVSSVWLTAGRWTGRIPS